MINQILAHYHTLSDQDMASKILFDAKNTYECTVVAVYVGGQWYVAVDNPDRSRVEDIDEIISDEFDAETIGWCVLKPFQKDYDMIIPFSKGNDHQNAITFEEPQSHGWLLVIRPRGGSRLSQLVK